MRGAAALARWGSAGTTPRSLSTGSSPRGSVAGTEDGEELVEVTLDLQDDDTIVLRSVEPAAARGELAVADGGGASSSSSRSPSIRRTSSYRLLQFSQELKAEAVARARQFSQDLTRRFSRSHSRSDEGHHQPPPPASGIESALAARAARRQRAQLDRTRSGAHRALRGLRFISSNKASNAWTEVQANFDRLARDGYLSRSDFAECIGMAGSEEFALELFDTLSRRRRMKVDTINKDELREIWQQITDNSFDSRLQIFFDMVDKNADGRIGEAEVKEIIMLSASANKLSRLKEQAEEYAALIMEELDPEELGYIEVAAAAPGPDLGPDGLGGASSSSPPISKVAGGCGRLSRLRRAPILSIRAAGDARFFDPCARLEPVPEFSSLLQVGRRAAEAPACAADILRCAGVRNLRQPSTTLRRRRCSSSLWRATASRLGIAWWSLLPLAGARQAAFMFKVRTPGEIHALVVPGRPRRRRWRRYALVLGDAPHAASCRGFCAKAPRRRCLTVSFPC